MGKVKRKHAFCIKIHVCANSSISPTFLKICVLLVPCCCRTQTAFMSLLKCTSGIHTKHGFRGIDERFLSLQEYVVKFCHWWKFHLYPVPGSYAWYHFHQLISLVNTMFSGVVAKSLRGKCRTSEFNSCRKVSSRKHKI